MTKAEQSVERELVAYYLLRQEDHPRASGLSPEVFSVGSYRAAWAKALEMDKGWLPNEIGLEWTDWSDHMDRLVTPNQVDRLRDQQLQAYAARHLRERVTMAGDLLAKRGHEAIEEASSLLESGIAEARAGGVDDSVTQCEAGTRALEQWGEAAKGKLVTIPMPLDSLERRLGGWRLGKLHLIVGRSSEHKTTLARQSADHAALLAFNALVWTMEDSSEELAIRTICAHVPEWDTRSLGTGKTPPAFQTKQRMDNAAQAVKELHSGPVGTRLRYIDKPNPTLSQVLRRIRQMCTRPDRPQLVVLDFGQLIQPDNGRDDYGFWGRLPSQLAGLAKDTGSALIVTCQVDKASTKASHEAGDVPRLHDILGGAAWKQACYGGLGIAKGPQTNGKQTVRILVDKWKGGAADWELPLLEVRPERDLIVGVA